MTEENEMEDFDPSKPAPLTDWENEPSFDDLYSDYKAAQEDHSILITKLDEYEVNMDGGKPINVDKGKSKCRPRLIRKQAEWKYPALEEPFLNTEEMFRIKARTFEDKPAAEQNELVLNWQWTTKIDKVEFVGDAVRCIVDKGTVIVKTGWEIKEELVSTDKEVPAFGTPEQSLQMMQKMVQAGKMSPEEMQQKMQSGEPMQIGTKIVQEDKKVLTKNNPTHEVCDLRNVVIDPTAKQTKDLRFVVHEYDTDMATLKDQEFSIDENGNSTGIYKNLKKLNISDQENAEIHYDDYDSTGKTDKTSFIFKDKPRKKLRAYEYWGYWDIDGNASVEPIVATWVDKVLIRMELSPFPFDGLPFSIAKYMPKENEVYGEPDGELLIENQESVGKMMRAAHDITSTQAVGQEFIDEQFFAGPSQKDNYRSGKTVYFRHGMNPATAIFKTTVDPVPKAIFDMIQYHQNDAESMSGTKSFSQGLGSQSLGSVAAGIRSTLDATAKRELSILRRLSEQLFKDLAMKDIIMNQSFLEEEEVVRITNEEFVSIRREDLRGEFDLIVDVSTPEKDNEKAEKLNMLMQTNAASMHPSLSKIIYARIAKLWKEPDLAKEVLEFEPQPDPLEEEMKKIQLENELLKNQKLKMEIANIAKQIESEDSKIEERESRTAQNLLSEVDENEANTRLKNAQADKIEQESDITKLNFVRMADGTVRQEEIDDKEAQWMNDQEIEILRQKHKQELDELKLSMKERSDSIKSIEAAKIASMNIDKELTIADMKARELGDKAMTRMQNAKGDVNGRI